MHFFIVDIFLGDNVALQSKLITIKCDDQSNQCSFELLPIANNIFLYNLSATSFQTRNVCETCMPPVSLNVTMALTFDLETPNSIGVIY